MRIGELEGLKIAMPHVGQVMAVSAGSRACLAQADEPNRHIKSGVCVVLCALSAYPTTANAPRIASSEKLPILG